jgi:20S proteasome alpha/beta subunit
MTVLVGILCQDGVVIGSDSCATFVAGQMRTIEQRTVKKVRNIGTDVIIAGTGHVGLGQRFLDVVTKDRINGQYPRNNAIDVCREISKKTTTDFSSTQADRNQFGALMAFWSKEGPSLCEFQARDFQPELKNDEIWYVSMGSGQPITDPFLGFLRRVFWKDKRPRVKEAIFAVTWALEHTIDLNPGGINGPSQIGVLENKVARLLTPDEITAHVANTVGAQDYLAGYPNQLLNAAAKTLPPAPATVPSSGPAAPKP